ncbi:MAG: hypothetical protein ACK51F_10485 [Rhodospirillales bacterium]|jgi:hypothetical protein
MNSESHEGPHERMVGRLRILADKNHSFHLGEYWDVCEEAADELDRLRAENVALREALAGTVNVLDLLRTYADAKYDYASSRAGTLVHVARTIDATTALLTPNAALCGHRDGETK